MAIDAAVVRKAARKARPSGHTAELAEFAVSTPFAALPAEAVEATKRLILDTVTCSVSGYGTEPGRVVSQFRADQGGRPEATLVVTGERLPLGSVAYVNAHLANILDADDTILNFNHFGSTIVMPALAAAELTGASGQDVIAAVAVGFDIAARVGLGLRDLEAPEPGEGELERTPLSGVSWASFGTAAAVGRLLGLDREQIANAYGVARFTAPLQGALANYLQGIGKRVTPWHKYAMFGAIAESGVYAAQLAQRGFQADTTILDRGSEFWAAFGGGGFDWSLFTDGVGDRWWITETSLKPYPFCRLGHSLFDLVARIVEDEGLTQDEIDEIELVVPPFPTLVTMASTYQVEDGLDVMASVPYGCAMIAAGVAPGPRWWDDEQLLNPVHHRFARTVRMRVNDAWRSVLSDQLHGPDGKFRRMPVEVTVTARGRRFHAAAEYMKGDPWTPESAMTDEELAAKVLEYCDPTLGGDRARQLVAAGYALDSAPDVGDLVASMTR